MEGLEKITNQAQRHAVPILRDDVTELDVSIIIAGVIAGAAPISSRGHRGDHHRESRVDVNLSLDGSILLAAMASFCAA